MNFVQLVELCRLTHVEMQQQADQAVDLTLVVRNWLFGRYIVEYGEIQPTPSVELTSASSLYERLALSRDKEEIRRLPAPTVRPIPAHGSRRTAIQALKGRPKTACRDIAPARDFSSPSSFIPQPSTFIFTMIPPGYKQTEVGVISVDWEASRVDAHAAITTGSRNTQDRVDDGPYPFFVRSQVIERINSYSYDGEAVLTAGDGVGTGKVFHYINGRFDIHQRVYRITEFDTKLSGKYFFYQFSTRFYDRIMAMTAKSSVDSVRMEMIAGMPIPLPPTLAEQEAIATALSDADALIDSLEQLIAKKRLLKQGAMQDLLTGKNRLPGFEGEWEVKKLGEVVGIRNERINPQAGQHSKFCIELEHLDQGSGILIGHTKTSETSSLKCVFQKGDVLFGKVVRELELVLPLTPEQTAIAAILSDIDAEIAALEAKLAKARQVKQGMMQELLTGKTRLVASPQKGGRP